MKAWQFTTWSPQSMLDLSKLIKTQAIKSLWQWLVYITNKVKEKTPEDTKTLIEWYEVSQNGKTWKIENNTEYAAYVEYGVWSIYNYHKNGTVYYAGDGAWMIRRTADEEEQNLADLIAKDISKNV